MKVRPVTLLGLAGLVWSAAGFNILRIGVQAGAAAVGPADPALTVLVFAVFGGGIFRRLVTRHSARIAGYRERQFFLRFFDPPSFAVMAVMMAGGISLRAFHLAPDRFIAVFYTGLGAALLAAGLAFALRYRQGLRAPAGPVHTP